jgi:hypothetical protein
MASNVVMAVYRPREGKDEDLRGLIARHVPTLRRLALITDRPALLLQASDGTYVEIFEWSSETTTRSAHDQPEIAEIWDAMEKVADFVGLDSLPEARRPFPHFRAVT